LLALLMLSVAVHAGRRGGAGLKTGASFNFEGGNRAGNDEEAVRVEWGRLETASRRLLVDEASDSVELELEVAKEENSKLKKRLVELDARRNDVGGQFTQTKAHELGSVGTQLGEDLGSSMGSSNYDGSSHGGSSGTCANKNIEIPDGQTCKIEEVSGAKFQTKECSFPQGVDTNGASFPTEGDKRIDDCGETCWNLKYNGGSSSWPPSVPGAQINSTLNTFKRKVRQSVWKGEGVHFNCVTMCTKKMPINKPDDKTWESMGLTDEYENGDVLCHVFKARAIHYTPRKEQRPFFVDSNSIYCNTVCKPGTDYSSEDNVGRNCKPGACDDKLCIDALTPGFTSAAALTQEAAAATSEAVRAAIRL